MHWAGISLACWAGDWRGRPRMGLHSSGDAAGAPRAARTTGLAATTPVGQANLVRVRRFYFLGFSRGGVLDTIAEISRLVRN